MEQYREKLKMQNALIAIGCGILALFCMVIAMDGNLITLPKPEASEHWQDFWQGFCTGAAAGILLLMVFFLARNLRAISDDKMLKKLYIKTNDERTEKIFTTARGTAMQVFLIGGLAAVCIGGYFSMTVGLTILGCVIFCSLSCIGFKLYFSAKL